ncbi:MAG TPA: hypothetical protein VHE79_10885, partial [Spirochaetia bacterium]
AAPDGASAIDAWRLAHEAERLFHGTPSGVDTGLALGPGLCVFHPRPGALPVRTELPGTGLSLVVSAVPRNDACGPLVAGIARRMAEGDAPTAERMAALGRIAEEAAGLFAALEAGSVAARHHGAERGADSAGAARVPDTAPVTELARAIAGLADEAMEHLRCLGLGNEAQDALLDAGREAGGLGGKLSGAGGGGAFYLVAPDRRTAGHVAAAIRRAARRLGVVLVAPVSIMRI